MIHCILIQLLTLFEVVNKISFYANNRGDIGELNASFFFFHPTDQQQLENVVLKVSKGEHEKVNSD